MLTCIEGTNIGVLAVHVSVELQASLVPRLSAQLFYYVRKKSWAESLGMRLLQANNLGCAHWQSSQMAPPIVG